MLLNVKMPYLNLQNLAFAKVEYFMLVTFALYNIYQTSF